MRRLKQLELNYPSGRGGSRPGAGRPRGKRPRVMHRSRERIPGHCPVHVTVRVRRGMPGLRNGRFVRAFRRGLAACSARPGFRVIHYSIQRDHLHFLIEARGKRALAAGMKSLGARIGRIANRTFGRSGAVLDGRYHHRVLRTPREVRHALAYVLLNARHHWAERHGAPPPAHFDKASSAGWFTGWRGRGPPAPRHPREVADPGTWLLRKGWRRHRLIDPTEMPGGHKRPRASSRARPE